MTAFISSVVSWFPSGFDSDISSLCVVALIVLLFDFFLSCLKRIFFNG